MNKAGAHSLVSQVSAIAALRAAEHQATANEGQQAGVPGMGPAPQLYHKPGGRVVEDLQHPGFKTFERLDRKMPQGSWFDPNLGPTRPIQFEIISYKVPQGTALWLFDYEIAAYRLSGIDPGDFIKAAAGRFGNQIAGDLVVGGSGRKNNIAYQLDPSPPAVARAQFEPPIGSGRGSLTTIFNSAAANNFSPASSAGTGLLPLRRAVQGAENAPFTIILEEGGTIALRCVIFNRLTSPVAAIEGRFAGYLINSRVSSALLNRVRPR